ncbi:MAG TPA: peptidase S10 [Patescibacteria group bacterium]|nr:peptidase S10 [Patescibacteria group bacterium]
MRERCSGFVSILVIMLLAFDCHAQDTVQQESEQAPHEASELGERIVETEHTVRIGGRTIGYTATAGTMVLRDEEGNRKAAIFFISYTKKNGGDAADRPITFSFNGGPGSSSVWLHLGLLGPRRVALHEDGTAPPPPYRLVENEYSLLDVTDLVFIDPVTTGFSRPAPGEDPKQFHGVDEDIKWVGEFIRLFLARNGRWASPKFLIGESYGTTRAAGLSGHLQERHGIYLNGIMLVSSILNFQTTSFLIGNDLPCVLFLPTYTATAWYHGMLDTRFDGDLAAALTEAEEFALGEYASVLLLGDRVQPDRYDRVVDRLAELTGLSREYIRQTKIRINIRRFTKELLRERRLTIGRLDSRFTGRDRDAVGERPEFDPSYAAIYGPYSAMLNDYVRRELGFESDIPYEILTGRVYPWNFGRYENRFINVAETLRSAISQNPALMIYVANGYFDLATPYLATRYTFDHLGLEGDLCGNVRMGYFEAGHMMYIHQPSLQKLGGELKDFIHEAARNGVE